MGLCVCRDAPKTPGALMSSLRSCAEHAVAKKGNGWLLQQAGLHGEQFTWSLMPNERLKAQLKSLKRN